MTPFSCCRGFGHRDRAMQRGLRLERRKIATCVGLQPWKNPVETWF
jgi:hypothetical protein